MNTKNEPMTFSEPSDVRKYLRKSTVEHKYNNISYFNFINPRFRLNDFQIDYIFYGITTIKRCKGKTIGSFIEILIKTMDIKEYTISLNDISNYDIDANNYQIQKDFLHKFTLFVNEHFDDYFSLTIKRDSVNIIFNYELYKKEFPENIL